MFEFVVWWTTAYFTPPDAVVGPPEHPGFPLAHPFEV